MSPRVERWVMLAADALAHPERQDEAAREMDALVSAMTEDELDALQCIIIMAEAPSEQETFH